MRSSPLQLRKYYTTELSFMAQPGYELVDQSTGMILHGDLRVDVQWKEGQQERQRTCLLSVELNDPTGTRFPCTFSISMVGLFEVIPEWHSQQVDILFHANAPALLYSAAREAIAMVTGRGPFPEVILPSITFVELPKEKDGGTDTTGLPTQQHTAQITDASGEKQINASSSNLRKK